MDDHEIIEFWGYHNLLRWNEDALKGSSIQQPAKTFLMTVGLPRSETWSIKFDNSGIRVFRFDNHFYQIGLDYEIPICIEEDVGCIVAIEHEKPRLINSSIRLFCESLSYYHEYRETLKKHCENNCEDVIEMTEKKIQNSDPMVFNDNNNWWPVIIEQMRNGFL